MHITIVCYQLRRVGSKIGLVSVLYLYFLFVCKILFVSYSTVYSYITSFMYLVYDFT